MKLDGVINTTTTMNAENMSMTMGDMAMRMDNNHAQMSTQTSSQAFESAKFFNEMLEDNVSDVRPTYQQFDQWIHSQSKDALLELSTRANDHFYKKGITFNVYDGEQSAERMIPYDLIPRIIELQEWRVMEAGCTQRIKALNAFLHDVYHDQNIIKAGIMPAQQVLANSCFEPLMLGLDVKGGIYAHVSGIDLIRHNDGQYYVLEDNLRTPSGVSYMVEAREISQNLMPELFQSQRILGVNHYPKLLKQTLVQSTPVENPVVVVLTPGRFNSAYFEHAFLAREMDVPLVCGYDLFVENGFVYLHSILGKVRVDVIYRRLDDAFLDPLAFNPDSMLGVAGLMAVYRAGNIVIANAPGTGVADDKSIYPYVGKMIEFYLGEKPILQNVHTWQCAEKEDLSYVLANLEQLVVKEAQGSGGYGMLIGPTASKAEVAEFRKKLIAFPSAYIAQPTLSLSVCPTLMAGEVVNRHIDLRPFVLSSPTEVNIVAGGLTRVALTEGSLVVNSSQGGGTKDSWVVDLSGV